MTPNGYILYPEKRGDLRKFLAFKYGDKTELIYAKANVRIAIRELGFPIYIKFDGTFLLNYGGYYLRVWNEFELIGDGLYKRANRIEGVKSFLRRV